ncbi:SDR family oxidoreductase [Streptomyces mirabilis]
MTSANRVLGRGGASSRPHPGSHEDADSDAIAIVGAGIVVPGAIGLDQYWQVLCEGPQLFSDFLPERCRVEGFFSPDRTAEDKCYQMRGGYITDPIPDPAGAYAGSDSSIEFNVRWLRRALADALHPVRLDTDARIGCVLGYSVDGNQHLEETAMVEGMLHQLGDVLGPDGHAVPEQLDDARATLTDRYPRIRTSLATLWPHAVGHHAVRGLVPGTPEVIMVDTACSSSLYALDIGVKSLAEGRQDVVVCGGSFALGPRNSVLFSKVNGFSSSGEVRSLDRDSDGALFSDGAAIVVAKRLSDALRDGDTVLGYVASVGTSSDGAGKAIYAPNVAGQRRAVQRAWAKDRDVAGLLSWVAAHATGTPAGDLCELTVLGEELHGRPPTYVTSNKPVIGHTGWAAGVASVIHVLLALRHSVIPTHHRFRELPPKARGFTNLRVPTSPVVWPAGDEPRVAAVSGFGFGFGGTNAHVLVTDRPPAATRVPRPSVTSVNDPEELPGGGDQSEALAIVAWSADLPGLDGRSAVSAWLRGGGSASPTASYGARNPVMPAKLRIPLPTQRVLDRCQMMAIACAEQLRGELGAVWEDNRELLGVFLGHMGPTRHSLQYAKRCYLDEVLSALKEKGGVSGPSLADFAQRIRDGVPASTEGSFPGIMPNVVAARIANYFDLHGPNMAVDTGFASALTAFEVARRYLASGDVELALVGGVNGNSLPEMAHLLGGLDRSGARIHEAAVLFAVTTVARAQAWALPVLATVTQAQEASVVIRGAAGDADITYLGADGAMDVLRALHELEQGHGGICRVQAGGELGGPVTSIEVGPGPSADAEDGVTIGVPWGKEESDPAPFSADKARVTSRYAARWVPSPASQTLGTETSVFPSDAVVVTATPAALNGLGGRASDPLVLSVTPCDTGPRRRHLGELTPETVREALGEYAGSRSVRVVTDLEELLACSRAREGAGWSGIADLHDLTFLVLQALSAPLSTAEGSVFGLFLGGHGSAAPHPFAGLFGGLFKSLALELAPCRVAAVFTSERTLEAGVRQLVAEQSPRQVIPLAAYRDGVRHVPVIAPAPAAPTGPMPLSATDVVVAVGGGYGITTEVLRAITARTRPTVYLIGSTPLAELAPKVRELRGTAAFDDKPRFLRAGRAAQPPRAMSELNAEYDRLHRVATIMDNVAELEARCGAGRVHYRQADVRDAAQVAAVVDEVHARHGRVDLVLHAAGINRASALTTKSLEYFREVRSVKVGGYANLRRAFAGRAPRMRCNFGSNTALAGQFGETDYASANDFLASAAEAERHGGHDEFTIGWTLWSEAGMGAQPVIRAFLARSGQVAPMSTSEGVAHFADELRATNREGAVYHLGPTELHAAEAKAANSFVGKTAPVRWSSPDRFYLDRVVERDEHRLLAERLFSASTDGYLAHHSVQGVGTLPGMLVLEIMAEAAQELVPGMMVAGFRDVSFERFLKLTPTLTANPRRIEATVTARSDNATEVQVVISGDITAPDGRVLHHDLQHFTGVVVMATAYPMAPRWPGLGPGEEIPVLDPYVVSGASVLLTGPFVTIRDTRIHPLGKRARYVSPVSADDPVFGRFIVPSLLLDGLGRTAVLTLVAGRYVPVAAPRAVRRIDLYEDGDDAAFGARYAGLELTVMPGDLAIVESGARNRFVASTDDGRIVAQMHDLQGIVLGYIDAVSGEPVPRSVVEDAEKTTGPRSPRVVAL